tara:strand:- start:4466 stop:5152 length:687 start_codon:yes stop_codon:yes gene_type:complete
MNQPLSRYLDHAVLKPEMTRTEAEEAINLGLSFNTRAVCIRPTDIELAKSMCRGTNTDVCVVLGFPHGYSLPSSKLTEAKAYAKREVDEVDMVSQFGMARGGEWESFRNDIEGVVQILHPRGILLKVIIESSVLLPDQISQATHICSDLGVAHVKTSTGFNGGGASKEAVEIMLNAVRGNTKVKASGGIRNIEQANRFIEMGCDRLGVGYSTTPLLFGDSSLAKKSDY